MTFFGVLMWLDFDIFLWASVGVSGDYNRPFLTQMIFYCNFSSFEGLSGVVNPVGSGIFVLAWSHIFWIIYLWNIIIHFNKFILPPMIPKWAIIICFEIIVMLKTWHVQDKGSICAVSTWYLSTNFLAWVKDDSACLLCWQTLCCCCKQRAVLVSFIEV